MTWGRGGIESGIYIHIYLYKKELLIIEEITIKNQSDISKIRHYDEKENRFHLS